MQQKYNPKTSNQNRPKYQYQYQSKRKIQPTPTTYLHLHTEPYPNRQNKSRYRQQQQQRVKLVQQVNKYCYNKHKGIKTTNSQCIRSEVMIQQFVFNQYFIPDCDYGYFGTNPMHDIYNYITNIQQPGNKPEQITNNLKQFKKIQQALPKPKTMSRIFIQQQRYGLHQHRIGQRSKTKPSLHTQTHTCIQVGCQVWVYCPTCYHIHVGAVLSQYKDSFLINFNQPLYGALKVPQYLISTQLNCSRFIPNIPQSDTYPQIHHTKQQQNLDVDVDVDVDMEALSIYLYLLDIKKQLIGKLRQYNNLADRKKKQIAGWVMDGIQVQEYGWIGVVINIITVLTKYIDRYYPIRLSHDKVHIKQKSMKVSRMPMVALSDIYLNINTSTQEQIEKQKQKQKITQKIKIKPKQQQQQQKEQQELKQRQGQEQEQADKNRVNVQNCVQLSIGILKNLQKKGKDYRIEQDHNYLKLQQQYKQDYSESIDRIHNKLQNIIKKLSK